MLLAVPEPVERDEDSDDEENTEGKSGGCFREQA